ncbi:Propeptide PepSY amd peptidase M4 [Cyanobacterium stanieri PCC 7202]|uniref:Propeptide PepSY amd peptidase M4 n=1 Tax=Cyanobacterium stanieri (strain ATCC 29140 / PCC 7202) TaxID=292563 RepID=K9YRQ9_CYASC|nr:Propeptide PepSY amd peptidase M4 [Cyanobacterium stanieri PCC 7202]
MRKIFLKIHQMIGLTVAFIIIIIGLTGSYLVWTREITPIIYNQINQVNFSDTSYSLDKVTQLLNTNYPDLELSKIVFPNEADDPFRLIVNTPEQVRQEIYIDAYDNKVLSIYPRNNTYDPFLHKIHTELLGGNIGKILLGLSGISLFILAMTGLYLWKGWKKINLGFKVRWSSKPKIINYDLHQVIGIFSFLLAINMAITGSILALDQPIKKIFFSPINDSTINVDNSLNNNINDELSLDIILKNAQNITGESNFTEVKFIPKKDTVELRFKQAYEINPRGKSYISFHSKTGELLTINKLSEQSFYKRFRSWSDVFHYGIFLGIFSMIIYLVFGLILVSLALTGFLIWWQKKFKIFTMAK